MSQSFVQGLGRKRYSVVLENEVLKSFGAGEALEQKREHLSLTERFHLLYRELLGRVVVSIH